MAKQLPESFVTRRRWSAEQARVVLDTFTSSGLSVLAFAKREGLDVQRVRRLVRRSRARVQAREPERRAAESTPRFVEVQHATASFVEVALRSGRVLRVHESIAPSVLRRLADALDQSEGLC